jgi:hypothetical protein
MYNTKYICTYQADDIFVEEKEKSLSEEEKDFILNCLYRNDLLYIFDIEDFEKEYKVQLFDDLYEKVKENDFLLSCIKQLAIDFNNEREEFGIVLLYSFELLYLAHPCISEFLETGLVSEKNMNLLKEKVFRK